MLIHRRKQQACSGGLRDLCCCLNRLCLDGDTASFIPQDLGKAPGKVVWVQNALLANF
jgi:hypothetical protein